MDELWTPVRGPLTTVGVPDLTEEELLSALSLLQLLAARDTQLSDKAAAALRMFADDLEAEHYDELTGKLAKLKLSEESVKALASCIHRQAARQLIFEELWEVAVVAHMNIGEDDVLSWLKVTWELDP